MSRNEGIRRTGWSDEARSAAEDERSPGRRPAVPIQLRETEGAAPSAKPGVLVDPALEAEAESWAAKALARHGGGGDAAIEEQDEEDFAFDGDEAAVEAEDEDEEEEQAEA